MFRLPKVKLPGKFGKIILPNFIFTGSAFISAEFKAHLPRGLFTRRILEVRLLKFLSRKLSLQRYTKTIFNLSFVMPGTQTIVKTAG